MEWTNVKDREPSEEGYYGVIVRFSHNEMGDSNTDKFPMLTRFTKDKKWLIQTSDLEITHWMKMPELPLD